MTRAELEAMRKAELIDLARAEDVPGRSRMTKAALVDALAARLDRSPADDVQIRTIDSGDQAPAESTTRKARRQALNERLEAYFEDGVRCGWVGPEHATCGLPAVAASSRCALHGGIDIVDLAVPIGGHLGFDTWPALLRHLNMATYDIDPIGLDPVIAEMAWHLTNLLYFDYFRVTVEGAEHIPTNGPAIIVANHGGAWLPYDAFMLSAAVANEAAVPRRLRVIGTEIFNMLPVVSHLYRKSGGAYASRDDAAFLLRHGRLVGVFPEGERGFMKPVWDAYQLQRFGRGGFLTLGEHHNAPVVPAAVVGSEEVHPAVGVSETLARVVRLLFPQQRVEQIAVVLNPIPLPARWHIRFLPPVMPEGNRSLRDPLRMLERTEAVRTSIQDALDDIVQLRGRPF